MSPYSGGPSAASIPVAPANGDLHFLAGGGEAGELIRARDWRDSPLGPIAGWPQSLRTAVDIMLSSRFAMFVWWGRELINLYNDAYRPFLGGKHPQSMGQSARAVWSEIWDQIGPRTNAVLERGESTYDEALLLLMERFGYAEETYFTFSYSPIRDDEGAVGGLFCAVTDETQRVIGERRMRLLRDIASTASETRTPEQVCLAAAHCIDGNDHDLPFALLYLNTPDGSSTCLAAPLHLTAGSSAAPLTAELTQGDGVWPFREALAQQGPVIVEGLARLSESLPSGGWQRPPERAVVVPLREHRQGPVAGFLVAGLNPHRPFDEDYRGFLGLLADQLGAGIARAHTYQQEHRRAEALAELDRAKTTFFSNISHEFRTPLTLMLGPVEEALRDASVTAPVRAQLAIAQRNALRLLKLVNSLLDFSRIEAGRVQASYEPTDLGALTRDLASTFRSAIERGGLQFVVDIQPLAQTVYVDREMWEKIVLNLLSNAFKYTFQGHIRLELIGGEQGVTLEVIDTGVGIPSQELPRLFERFHRVEGIVGRTQEGSGIGLALVQELVRLHGGTIEVTSEVGRGSVFRVRLPWGSAHLPAERLRPEVPGARGRDVQAYLQEALRWMPPPNPSSSQRLPALHESAAPIESHRFAVVHGARILLADDNSDMRDYVRELLSSAYRVEAVADGAQALDAARRELPDLVIADIMMPRLDGFGLLQALRAEERLLDVPVILLSARAGEEARIEGFQAGADDYLVKPFSARELTARIGAHLALRAARREALDAVRVSEQRMRQLFQQAPGFMCLLGGPDHRFEFANDSYHLFVGERPLLGKSAREAFPELATQGFFELLDEVYRSGEPITRRDTPIQLRRWPGAPLQGHYIDFIYQPVKDPLGEVTGIFVEGLDVTARVTAQRELRRSEELRQLALDAARMGTFTWYPSQDRTDADERMLALFGLSSSGPLSLALALGSLIHPEDRQRYAAAVARAVDPTGDPTGEGMLREEIRIRRADDGRERWLSISGQVYFGGEPRQALYMVGTGSDVTGRVQARLDLESADRQKDEFLAMLAHELRNPLAPIDTASQLLARAAERDEHSRRAVEVIRRQVTHLTRLVDDLMDVSRITRGRIELQREPCDLARVVAQAVEMLQPQLRDKNHQLALISTGSLPVYVTGDFARLVQCVGNLLANAIKYTARGGTIHVRTVAEEQRASVEVSDNGAGIAAELLPRVFDLFVQSERTLDRAQGGLGIGLAVVRRLVEMHGGQVSAVSEGEGRGSTFSIRLPRIAGPSSAAVETPLPRMPPRRVLIVDDNTDAADSLAALLRMEGHEVEAVYDAPQALERVAAFTPDIALLDLGLPEMNGYELAQRLRSLPQSGRLRLVALTGYGQVEDRQKTRAAGFHDHLVKPVDPALLRGALAAAPARSGAAPSG